MSSEAENHITPANALAEVKREIGLRYGFYKKQIARGKMTELAAHVQIARMTAAAEIIGDLLAGATRNALIETRRIDTKL